MGVLELTPFPLACPTNGIVGLLIPLCLTRLVLKGTDLVGYNFLKNANILARNFFQERRNAMLGASLSRSDSLFD